jgi:hypothetical protein
LKAGRHGFSASCSRPNDEFTPRGKYFGQSNVSIKAIDRRSEEKPFGSKTYNFEGENMGITCSVRIVVVIAALVAISVTTVAQTQNQNSPNQNQAQTQQNQNSTQNQTQPNQAQPNQAQPQQKQSFWQKMKQSALQGAQNTTQQGNQQVQQGAQGAANGMQQATQGLQQAAMGGNSGSASLGGNNSSSCGATCFNAGPFLANVSQMTLSQQGGWHVIAMDIQFQNTTNQPLIIAYHDGSMVMTDNNGATYQGAGGNPGELQGMGIDRGGQTDPQFVLGAGQTSSARFSVARARPANSPIGTGYTYNLTIDQLQTQNGASALVVRSYNLNFPTLTPGSASSLTSFASGSTGNGTGASTATTSTAVRGTVPAAQTAGPVGATPNTPGVTNAAMKTPVATTAKPSPAVKPIPATTNAKKPTTTNNNQPSTSNNH